MTHRRRQRRAARRTNAAPASSGPRKRGMTESIFLLVAYLIGRSLRHRLEQGLQALPTRAVMARQTRCHQRTAQWQQEGCDPYLLGDAFKGLARGVAGSTLCAASRCGFMDRTAVRPGRIHRAPLPGDAGLPGWQGVATALGVLAGLAGTLALATLVVWLAVAFISRYSSAAAPSAGWPPPLTHWLVGSPPERRRHHRDVGAAGMEAQGQPQAPAGWH